MTPSFSSFMSHATAQGARSTALHALQWVIGLLLAGIPGALWASAPGWMVIFLAIGLGLVLLVFLGAYIFLLVRNPDALRSEEFSLNKMAIEKGLIGDSTHGFVAANEVGKNVDAGFSKALSMNSYQGEQE